MAWASLADARRLWNDAPADDAILSALLDVAQERCELYAPAVAAGAPTPARYTRAVVNDAREGWAAAQRTGTVDVIGIGEYAVRVRPLADHVRSDLRPPRAVPTFGSGLTPAPAPPAPPAPNVVFYLDAVDTTPDGSYWLRDLSPTTTLPPGFSIVYVASNKRYGLGIDDPATCISVITRPPSIYAIQNGDTGVEMPLNTPISGVTSMVYASSVSGVAAVRVEIVPDPFGDAPS